MSNTDFPLYNYITPQIDTNVKWLPRNFFLVYKFCILDPSGLSKTEPVLFIKTFISDVRQQSVVIIFLFFILLSFFTNSKSLYHQGAHPSEEAVIKVFKFSKMAFLRDEIRAIQENFYLIRKPETSPR